MKKAITFILLVCIAMLCGCSKSGNVNNVRVDFGKSEIFSQHDMDSAINLIKKEFSSWDGCELHSITYVGDGICSDNIQYCNTLRKDAGYDECIIFKSSFHSPKSDAGSWEPDEEYTDWSWHLARKDNGAWTLLTWGYA